MKRLGSNTTTNRTKMKIKKCTVTTDEVKIAIQAYLKTQGVDLPVQSIERTYTYGSQWEIEFVEPVEAAPPNSKLLETADPKPETMPV